MQETFNIIFKELCEISARSFLSFLLAITMILIVYLAINNRNKLQKGIGVRIIQFVAIGLLIPAVAILALNEVIDGCSVSAIIGAIIGYLFSNISEFDRSSGSDSKE